MNERFNPYRPFRAKNGWKGRLLGILERTAFPYVVALLNEDFGAEELHCYDQNGLSNSEEPDNPLNLVNDEERNAGRDDFVEIWVRQMSAIPPDSNPFLYDLSRAGTSFTSDWTAMHEGNNSSDPSDTLREVVLVNTRTGQRLYLDLVTKMTDQAKAKIQKGSLL